MTTRSRSAKRSGRTRSMGVTRLRVIGESGRWNRLAHAADVREVVARERLAYRRRLVAELGTPCVWLEREAASRLTWPPTWSLWLQLVCLKWPGERWRRRRQRLALWNANRRARA